MITTKRTYGLRELRAEYDADPCEPGKFFAQAWNDGTGDRRELQMDDADTAHEWCIAAVDPESAIHMTVWAPVLRALDDIERDARSFLKDRRATENIGDARGKKFVAGFATGYRNTERGITSPVFKGDDVDWSNGYRAGVNLHGIMARTDARLQNRVLADIRSFREPGDAYDAMRADCFAFLRVLDEHLQKRHAVDVDGRETKTWGHCGDLGSLRENLRETASAFGLIYCPDEF